MTNHAHNFYRTAIGLALNAFASRSISTGVLLVLLIETSFSQAVLNTALIAIITLCVAPLGGLLSDRFNARLCFLGISICDALICVAYALCLGNQTPLTTVLHILAVATGALGAFASPNQQVVLAHITDSAGRAQKIARTRLLINIARAIAPGCASLILTALSTQFFFYIFSALYCCSGILVCLVSHNELQRPTQNAKENKSTFRASIAYLRYATWFVILAITSAVQAGAWLAGFRLATADYFLSAFHSPQLWGYILSTFNVGLLLGSVLAQYLKLKNDIFWALVFPGLLALPLTLFYGTHALPLFFISAFLAGILFDFTIIYGQSAIIDGIPRPILGTVSSFSSCCEQAGIASAYLALFIFSEHSSHTFILSCIVCTVTATICALIITRIQFTRKAKTHAAHIPHPWVARSWAQTYSNTYD
ncbi:MFS transporter [Corynebacterium sp. sy039]|uniref:MFS transporter n=1 Tax=Corynebacterium sp. sy039 TaxID=2599641 RepID=UPI0011B4A085|nr:MFS transporter [Corynebacterium sp. sy039]QDZ42269.1 MFS transporter [Corynebacterium sp. sy039]